MPRKFDFVSPGVQITEIDQSKLEPALREDGLLLIGTAKTGPALKPIKINSLENFIDVFGKPVSGKGTINSDVWRDGNNQGPTYAAYAAQAWLASNTSPVTFVRLLGEQSPNATTAGEAGWDLGGAVLSGTPSANGTAYGLFMMPSGAVGANIDGTLAAIIYTTGSALTLSGTVAGGTGHTTSSAGTLIKSVSSANTAGTFRLEVHTGGTATYSPAESLVFHFDPDKKDGFIRNVLNTNPQRIDSTQFASGLNKNYWVGEVYEEAVSRLVTSVKTASGEQYAMLLPLASGSLAANNLTYHKAEARESKTGWIINRNPSPIDDKETAVDRHRKLFRLCALSQGSYFEKNYYVTIEDLQLGSVKNPNSTFTIKIRNLNGDVVEQFSNINLDRSSENFIEKKIGTQYQTWSDDNERYELFGEYPNNSDYVRVEMSPEFDANDDTFALPFGFFGPVQPKGFSILMTNTDDDGDAVPDDGRLYPLGTTESGSAANVNAFVRGGNISTSFWGGDANSFISASATQLTASFTFPRLKLSEEDTARNGVNYNAKDILGLRHKFKSKNSRDILADRSYIDLLRYQGGGIDLHTTSNATQHSFVFSMDEVRKSSGKYYWQSGSAINGDSITSTEGTNALLTSSVRQFAVPMFGGFDGLDITRVNPFSNSKVLSGKNEENSSAFYSISKAIDSISDSEVVRYDVISIPDLTNATLSDKLLSNVESRGDALALIDLNDDYLETYENSGVRTGGTLSTVLSTARSRDLNTSYAAAYYPRIRMRDTLSGNGDVFIAPATVAAAGALAFSDANSDGPWFAPAGFNRGGISILGGNDGPRVIGTWKNLSKADRDELYELNINPVARFPAIGEVVIFGQKTLQQTPSALDRINVRRLMIFLKKKIGAIADTILFDQNVDATFNRFKSRADLILSDVQARLGITEFKIVLDSTTTTPDLVDQNILYAKIFVKPARSIEFIAIDFIITKTGVEF